MKASQTPPIKDSAAPVLAAAPDRTAFSRGKVRDMTYIGAGAVLIAACAWISVPTVVPFTLQTLGVFTVTGLLGGRRGSLAVLVYLLLGAAGAPVFAGFTGGPGILLGALGGYLIGFLLSALLMWGMEAAFGSRRAVLTLSMLLGMLTYYAAGTAWFMAVYARNGSAITLGAALGKCVLPFVIPDLIKVLLALLLTERLRQVIR